MGNQKSWFTPSKKKKFKYNSIEYSKKEMSYSEDIAKEVSGYLELDYDLCLAVQREIFNFVVDETKERDVYSISLPCVGVLHLNNRLAKRNYKDMVYKYKKTMTEDQMNKLDFWAHRILTMDAYKADNNLGVQETPHFYIPAQSSIGRWLPKEYTNRRFMSAKNKDVDIYASIEAIQNEHFNKMLLLQ